MRTPRMGRRRSIVVPGTHGAIRNFPIGRLNNYDPKMKMHRGPVSLDSDLESIDEALSSDKEETFSDKNKQLVFGHEYSQEE